MKKIVWIKLIETYRKKCEKITCLSKDIRYAGAFNEYGRTIAGKIKPGIKPIFSPNIVREEYFAIASTMRLRNKSAKGLGELKYIFINHKKINILLFYKNNVTYYITINSKVNPNPTLIKKIEKIII
ncbi:MAG: hypothetical protein VX587_02505 [Thermoproteota archaeon]|nr:hypothetical protein [Thermoproteota archaeon]